MGVVVGLSCVSAPYVSTRTVRKFSDAFVAPLTFLDLDKPWSSDGAETQLSPTLTPHSTFDAQGHFLTCTKIEMRPWCGMLGFFFRMEAISPLFNGSRMKTTLALLASFSTVVIAAHAQGSLTPPGPPAQTMKSLAQIEARTPISSAPFTITSPGSYYLTTNLTVSSGNAINISNNNVMLDLNGFQITSTSATANGTAINFGSNVRNVTVVNGFIESGVTNNGGSYTGPGFVNGINGNLVYNARVSGVSVAGVLTRCIFLANGGAGANGTIVESCTARTCGGNGIYASVVRACTATDCGATAIQGDSVSDSFGESTAGGYGVIGLTVQNCFGSSSSGVGLSSSGIAFNSYGKSVTGVGIAAYNSAFCVANRPNGTAISGTIANGCMPYFSGGTNIVTYKYNMP